jgi:hypothetical protein
MKLYEFRSLMDIYSNILLFATEKYKVFPVDSTFKTCAYARSLSGWHKTLLHSLRALGSVGDGLPNITRQLSMK